MTTSKSDEVSFFLRGVNYETVTLKYYSGVYKSLTPGKIEDVVSVKTVVKQLGGHGVFKFLDKGSVNKITVGTNVYLYNALAFNENAVCFGCRRLIRDTGADPVGIPMTKDVINGIKVYYGDGCYCSPNCISAQLDEEDKKMEIYRDPLYVNSRTLLIEMCYDLLGILEVKSAQDYRLLKCNGGTLDNDQWSSGFYKFTRTVNVRQIPTMVLYEQET